MHRMPEGRPESQPHTKGVIIVGIAQGLVLTTLLFLMFL